MPDNRWEWFTNRRRVLWLVVAVLAGVALLSAANLMEGTRPAPPAGTRPQAPSPRVEGAASLRGAALELESQLRSVLSQVRGAGQVEVSVTLAAGPKRDFATNTKTGNRDIEEKDKGGSARTTKELNADSQLAMARGAAAGGDGPVVLQESGPRVQGVLVVAPGADDPVVRARLTQAVQTLLGIGAHQVEVLPGR